MKGQLLTKVRMRGGSCVALARVHRKRIVAVVTEELERIAIAAEGNRVVRKTERFWLLLIANEAEVVVLLVIFNKMTGLPFVVKNVSNLRYSCSFGLSFGSRLV